MRLLLSSPINALIQISKSSGSFLLESYISPFYLSWTPSLAPCLQNFSETNTSTHKAKLASQEHLLYLAAAQLSKIVGSLLQTSKQDIKPSCSVALGKITNVTPELIKLKGLFFFWQTGNTQIQILYQPADRKKKKGELKPRQQNTFKEYFYSLICFSVFLMRTSLIDSILQRLLQAIRNCLHFSQYFPLR